MELEEFQAHACACESAIVQGVFIYDRRLSCFCHVFSGLNHLNEHTFMYVYLLGLGVYVDYMTLYFLSRRKSTQMLENYIMCC